jgi:hypothetical protein
VSVPLLLVSEVDAVVALSAATLVALSLAALREELTAVSCSSKAVDDSR